MEQLIADEFGLDYAEFTGYLRLFDARVCGESAVYAYICDQSPDKKIEWKPIDLRIAITLQCDMHRFGYIAILTNIMKMYGYDRNDNYDISESIAMSKNIYRKNYIYHKDDKVIIVTFIENYIENMRLYDLSILNVIWNIRENKYILLSDKVGNNIRDMRLCICCENNPDSKVKKNVIDKIKSWGFRVFSEI